MPVKIQTTGAGRTRFVFFNRRNKKLLNLLGALLILCVWSINACARRSVRILLSFFIVSDGEIIVFRPAPVRSRLTDFRSLRFRRINIIVADGFAIPTVSVFTAIIFPTLRQQPIYTVVYRASFSL